MTIALQMQHETKDSCACEGLDHTRSKICTTCDMKFCPMEPVSRIIFESPTPICGPVLRDALKYSSSIAIVKSAISRRQANGTYQLTIELVEPSTVTESTADNFAQMREKYPHLTFSLPPPQTDDKTALKARIQELTRTQTIHLAVKREGVDFKASPHRHVAFADKEGWEFVEIPPGGAWNIYMKSTECPLIFSPETRQVTTDSSDNMDQLAQCGNVVIAQRKANFESMSGFVNALFHVQSLTGRQLKVQPRFAPTQLENPQRKEDEYTHVFSFPFKPNCNVGMMNDCTRNGLFSVRSSRLKNGECVNSCSNSRFVVIEGDDNGVCEIEIDFGGYYVRLSHIMLRSGPSAHMRDFEFAGVMDRDLVCLARVTDCVELNGMFKQVTYKLETRGLKKLVIRQTKNWSGTHEMCLSCVNLFGTLLTSSCQLRKEKAERDELIDKRLSILQEKLAKKEASDKILEEEKQRARSAIRLKKKDPLMYILYEQFCDCFELPLRQALPGMSEEDIEYTLDVMFARLPDRLQPRLRAPS